jgi:protein SCO1
MKRTVAALLAFVCTGNPAAAASLDFNNAELTTDNGESIVFSPDLFRAPVTIVSFTFTGCTSVCPTASLVMDQAAQLAGAKGADIAFLTITLDPLNDVPEVLAAHRRNAGLSTDPGWRWITGEPSAVIGVVERLGMKWGVLDEHPSFFLLVAKGGVRADSIPELETTAAALLDAALQMADK